MQRCLFFLLLFSSFLHGQRPNVLWITIEDTSPQFIGAYGNEDVRTPNIDRLAREGVRFDRVFAGAPVCAIARNTLITGMSPNKLGTGHHRSKYPIPDFIRGYPAYLRDAGYYTSNNAKTDYNTVREPEIIAESWDESSRKAGWWKRAPGQPFFSVFNFAESHQSRTMTNPFAWYKENVLQHLPEDLRTDSTLLTVPPVFRDSPEMRGHLARVYNSINLMDLRVGQLLQRLEDEGLRDSTIIFFYADHGEAVPGGKCTATGLGYRVPFIVWCPPSWRHLLPWQTPGVSDELLVFEDLGPTLISLTGGTVPEYMDGRPALGESRQPAPAYVFSGRNRLDETPDLARSVTDGRYLYTRNFLPRYPPLKPQKYGDVSDISRSIRRDGAAGRLSATQRRLLERQPTETLYDLENDPWELHNLANEPAYRERMRTLRWALARNILAQRDVHFLPEAKLARLEMPYVFRQSAADYPLKTILSTALADPYAQQDQLLRALQHVDPTVRYWAATTLGQHPFDAKVRKALLRALADPDPTVAIQAAGGLARYTDEVAAGAYLGKQLRNTDPYLTLAALQQIQYSGAEVATELVAAVAECLPALAEVADKNIRYNLRSCAQTILFLQRGTPLYYEGMEQWLRPGETRE
ncbi:MAG: sulfatase-like hydrolase/transferase [Bacteroidota bacterium]